MQLSERVKGWRKALVDADTGPLCIAIDVVKIVDDWETYRKDAKGLTASAFLRRELGRGRDVAFFRRRARAVTNLGEHIRRKVNHNVAVWIDQNFSGPEATRAVFVVCSVAKNGNNAFSYAQARPIVLTALNRKTEKQPRECPRCKLLEEEVRLLRDQLEKQGTIAS